MFIFLNIIFRNNPKFKVQPDEKIVGGDDAVPNSIPFQVQTRLERFFFKNLITER